MKNFKFYFSYFLLFLIPSVCFGQNSIPTWENIKSSSLSREQAVKTCFIQGEAEYFHESKLRQAALAQWQKDHVGEGVADQNELRVFSWSTEGIRWRVDTRRLYPLLKVGRSQLTYDGEKYYSLNEIQSGTSAGAIGAERLQAAIPNSWSNDDFTTFSASTVFGSGMVRNLDTQWFIDKKFPVFQKEEIVSGYKCQKFVYHQISEQDNTSYDVLVWFSPELKLIVKAETSTSETQKDGATLLSKNIYKVESAKQFSNVWVPTLTKIEIYSNRLSEGNKNFVWLATKVFKTNTVHINEPGYLTVFQQPFAIGTPYVDLLEDPGIFQITGGAMQSDINAVRVGDPPPLELSEIQPNGEAPEVVRVQQAIEEAERKGENPP